MKNKQMKSKEENKIEIGTVVRLKSGGPAMTVRSLSGINGFSSDRNFTTNWFVNEQLYQGDFQETSLEII